MDGARLKTRYKRTLNLFVDLTECSGYDETFEQLRSVATSVHRFDGHRAFARHCAAIY